MAQSPPLRGDSSYRDEIVRIAEITVNTNTIEGLTFSNCRIVGPAILILLDDVDISHCRWDAPGLDSVFWEISPDRSHVVGAVGVRRCSFSNCTFDSVGVAGSAEVRAIFAAGFSSEP